MKTGDLVDTSYGPGRLKAITWRRRWEYGRSRTEAVMIVEHPGEKLRVYYSDQVRPYDSRMSETSQPEPVEEPQPDTDNGDDNGGEEEQ